MRLTRTLVLDTSVALKFYLPEEGHEEAVGLLEAAEISKETGVIVYDALFLALAEDADTVMVTADGKLLNMLKSTRYASLASSLQNVGSLLF